MTDHDTTIAQMKAMVQRFIEERDWEQFHDPKNLSMSIAIETAELMEHFQWQRTEQLERHKEDPGQMGEIREEVADIFCYLLSFAITMDIDLCAALEQKMVKNRDKYPAERFRGRFE